MTPVKEHTWRDQKQLHRIFAFSSAILLAATIAMFVDDHTRQWKTIQRTAERIDARVRRWQQLQHETESQWLASRKSESAVQQREPSYLNWYGYLPLPGRKCLELPVLDAFHSPRRIDNLWSEGLEIDYHFRKVRRFDRCTTCHRAVARAEIGTANQPAYAQHQLLELVIEPLPQDKTPSGEGKGKPSKDAARSPVDELERSWGMRLVAEGLLESTAVVVQWIRSDSPAARATILLPLAAREARDGKTLREALLQPARSEWPSELQRRGLIVGDLLARINGEPVDGWERAVQQLVEGATAGRRMTLTVRRGLPHPYASHPRLDLYVGSSSPHDVTRFGCSICHEGQGSATVFSWASHAPNNEAQRSDWRRNYGWFNNPHWLYPMYPLRFAESACLKCHHDVAELGPSSRYADPPAPKVVRGFQLIQTFGCFGCHEINGYDGQQRIGPDLRAEPNTAAAALRLKADPGFATLNEADRADIEQLVQTPDREEVRRRVAAMLNADAAAAEPRFSPEERSPLASILNGTDVPGALRKRGPSLRFIAQKLAAPFSYEWIDQPQRFRPTTRMPQSLGLRRHLDGAALAASERFEPVEILAMVTYLRGRSQEYAYLPSPEGRRPEDTDAKVARGRTLFRQRGCLACHTHKDFADAEAFREPRDLVQGPDLSGIADKLSEDRGRRWLYSWIKDPSRYDPRTLMPKSFLDPIRSPEGATNDPAEDIVEFLLARSSSGWSPSLATLANLDAADPGRRQAIDDVTKEYLRDVFAESLVPVYAERGIPASLRSEVTAAERELLVADGDRDRSGFRLPLEQKLAYIGVKALNRYGCHGCHDIPGMESAKPIGPVLTNWGRKDEAQLAFETVLTYLANESGAAVGGESPNTAVAGAMRDFYARQIREGRRAGFIFQKLREPRSYDYRRADHKKYAERLRMPQFRFDDEQREAIITFVLGLVAEPPTERYVYGPDARRRAVLAGERLLEKYQCGACHVLQADQWHLAFAPGSMGPQPPTKDFPFLKTPLAPQQLSASAQADRSGLRRAKLEGMPLLDRDGFPFLADKDGLPLEPDETYEASGLEYTFELWRSAAVDGHAYRTGVRPVSVLAELLDRRVSSRGGFLTKYLLPHVAREGGDPNAASANAWGWLPPPLIGEGEKVQPDWLFEFLLNPRPIRPAAVMRMPAFNLSPAEATALVAYFAAVDDSDYPYEYRGRVRSDHFAAAEQRYQAARTTSKAGNAGPPRTRLDSAMAVVTDANFCIRCHKVGDFDPQTTDRGKGPDLAAVYRRLRPDYVRRWIANPKSVLPYTGMPVNIPYDPESATLGGISQSLYPGTSVEQLEALVDLLTNYDEYAEGRSLVTPLVAPVVPSSAPNDPGAATER